MIRTNRRGEGVLRVRALVPLGLIALAIVLPANATEPDGPLRLKAEHLTSFKDGGFVVRLELQPFVVLDQATLTVSAPLAFDLESLTPSMHTRFQSIRIGRDRPSVRSTLERLDPAIASSLEFELILSSVDDGILEFVVEGRDAAGRVLRDAVGLAVRGPGSCGVYRLGALEFPAVVLPAKER